MTIAVRYQSQGGNTRLVAEAIAAVAGVTAAPIDVPVNDPVDVLFVGGGVYAFGLHTDLVLFLENLNPARVKTLAAFTTSSITDKTKDIAALARAKEIAVSKSALAVKFALKNFGGKSTASLSAKQQAAVEAFVTAAIH